MDNPVVCRIPLEIFLKSAIMSTQISGPQLLAIAFSTNFRPEQILSWE
jgi:hypothetical protein